MHSNYFLLSSPADRNCIKTTRIKYSEISEETPIKYFKKIFHVANVKSHSIEVPMKIWLIAIPKNYKINNYWKLASKRSIYDFVDLLLDSCLQRYKAVWTILRRNPCVVEQIKKTRTCDTASENQNKFRLFKRVWLTFRFTLIDGTPIFKISKETWKHRQLHGKYTGFNLKNGQNFTG